MLRTTTLGTLLGAMLVVVSGATVGLVAASQAPAPGDVSPTELAAQDNETMGNETATVTFLNQTSNGSAVLVNETTLSEGGFVAIHLSNKTSPGNFSVGPVVGNSTFLEAGTHEDLVIRIYENETLEESQFLVAMPHRDTDDNQEYDFPEADDPYTVDGPAPVIDEAFVEVDSGVEAIQVTEEAPVAVENVSVENETMEDADEETMGNETMDNETEEGVDYALGR